QLLTAAKRRELLAAQRLPACLIRHGCQGYATPVEHACRGTWRRTWARPRGRRSCPLRPAGRSPRLAGAVHKEILRNTRRREFVQRAARRSLPTDALPAPIPYRAGGVADMSRLYTPPSASRHLRGA